MSFQQGLSGLNAASKNLEVIGNNVANANTVGFKQGQTQFADVYASSLNGSGSSQTGIGVQVAQVKQQFTQGNITTTNNSLDLAINGGGFFRLSNDGNISYSRNGQFQLDKEGFIVNAEGQRLTGYTANPAGQVATGVATDININTQDLAPRASAAVTGLVNLDSRKDAMTLAGFDPEDPTTYHHSTSVSVYDSLGNSHTLQNYFVKTAPGEWSVMTTVDGTPSAYTPPAAPVATATMSFSGTGVQPTINPATPTVNFTVATGAAPLAVTVDLSGSTQFGANFSVNSLTQDGYGSGRLAGFDIAADGMIVGRYSNGQSANLAQVALANFVNPNGLRSLGNNVWAESSTSGAALVGAPNTGSMGVLQSSAVEDSNVDLTAELVNMITAQRVYQANAQTIKTQDQVLQTLVNLR
ncbi:flagellar hook protein FlgE [Pseudomethylobacillus aquaticus]|uniref:Flagellar hook protein FlgE n=1 Tax=Pseudomethylobacillus aquaticus TaxID=2676064 RepID=A0A3N0V040_9PROT|nr:flagellar hook protein FlgE [Pseudomethylobacillus aquaticus]ROH86140.1 flagellar hook protein FlgE [Pseudomethylobacillus aquaticus]